MISLSKAKMLVEKVRGEKFPEAYNDFTLHEWSRKGVISHLKAKNGKTFYPDIVTNEILTALKLKNKYSLSEIADARRCLELEGNHPNQITEEELVRFINCSKLFNDKKLVMKLTIKKLDSLDKIKELIDDLFAEKRHLEVIEAYLKEFYKTEKELEDLEKRESLNYVS